MAGRGLESRCRCHPDKRAEHGLDEEQAHERMQEVNTAKDVLLSEIFAESDAEDHE